MPGVLPERLGSFLLPGHGQGTNLAFATFSLQRCLYLPFSQQPKRSKSRLETKQNADSVTLTLTLHVAATSTEAVSLPSVWILEVLFILQTDPWTSVAQLDVLAIPHPESSLRPNWACICFAEHVVDTFGACERVQRSGPN